MPDTLGHLGTALFSKVKLVYTGLFQLVYKAEWEAALLPKAQGLPYAGGSVAKVDRPGARVCPSVGLEDDARP